MPRPHAGDRPRGAADGRAHLGARRTTPRACSRTWPAGWPAPTAPVPVLWVTHDRAQVDRIADRRLVVRGPGRRGCRRWVTGRRSAGAAWRASLVLVAVAVAPVVAAAARARGHDRLGLRPRHRAAPARRLGARRCCIDDDAPVGRVVGLGRAHGAVRRRHRAPPGARGARRVLARAGRDRARRRAEPRHGVRARHLPGRAAGHRPDRRDDDRQLDQRHRVGRPPGDRRAGRPPARGGGPPGARPAVAEASRPYVRAALRTALTARSRARRRSASSSCPAR